MLNNASFSCEKFKLRWDSYTVSQNTFFYCLDTGASCCATPWILDIATKLAPPAAIAYEINLAVFFFWETATSQLGWNLELIRSVGLV
jgi:hypothetical protein